MNPSNSTILLSFDVEDWFQVENFKQYIPFSSWPNCELRVEKNVHRILDLLDSIKLNNPTNSTNSSNSSNPSNPSNSTTPPASRLPPNGKDSPCLPSARLLQAGALRSAPCGTLRATFFVLGWLAERLPHLVREIQSRGHEVASHGYNHVLCKEQSANELKVDLVKSKELLEDITGAPIYGYRAPGFSVNQGILSLIEDSGYLYDSSFNSFSLNRRYGQVNFSNNGENGISVQISETFYELPITNLRIGNQILPWGGGGYFRLIPSFLFRYGVQSILKKHGTYLFYMHPWEVDADQPRMREAQILYRFRHYTNLNKTLHKLSFFVESFKECHFKTCYQYLKSNEAWGKNNTTS